MACYDAGNKLIDAKAEKVTIPANTIDGTYTFTFELNAPKTNTIKFFGWSADGKLMPHTFVKTLK